MQDNKNSEFDTALVDRAWAQLHEQLEVAMPQRKRRAFAWWWAVFALVGTSLLAFWLWPITDDLPKENSSLVREAVIAELSNDPTANHNVPTTESSNLSDANHRVSAADEMNVTETAEPLNLQTNQSPNLRDANHRVSAADQMNVAKIAEPSNLQAVEPSNLPDANHRVSIVDQMDVTKTVTVEQSNRQTAEPTDLIAIINHQPSTTNQPSSDLTIEPSNPQKTSPWNFYLESQAGFTLGNAIHEGLSFGAGIQRRLTKKTKLEAGLQYQLQRSSSFISDRRDGFANAEEFFDTTSSPGSAYSLTLQTASQNLAVRKVNLYIGGHFQVKPRLSLGIGLQASYFTHAFVLIRESGITPSTTTTGSSEGLGLGELNLYDEDISVYQRDITTNAFAGPYQLDVRRWQLSSNMSVRYRFARHWETSLQYQAHLTSWPNKDRTFGGSSTVQLGLRYYLR